MKILIYYVCFGQKYKNFLDKSLYSLLYRGQYKDDIVVLTHFKEEEFIKSPQLKIININPENDNITYYRNVKPKIYEFVDLNNYDFVVYLDCDTLINTNKFNDLIQEWSKQDNIFIQKDLIPIWRNKPYCGCQVLTKAERCKYSSYAFNAGIIAASSKLFLSICTEWNAKNKEHNFMYDDQGNLVFVILRKFIDKIKYTYDTTITNRKNDEKREETILHFLAKSERAFYSYFNKYIDIKNE